MKPRVLVTTTSYPPSVGGVQTHVAALRREQPKFDTDIVTLWRENRTDWLLGSTIRLKGRSRVWEDGVRQLGWSRAARLRMLPWVTSYYATIGWSAARIAAEMGPELDRICRPDQAIIHNHRVGREFLSLASLQLARLRGVPFVITPHHHPKWNGHRYRVYDSIYRQADAVLAATAAESNALQALGVSAERIHVIGGAAEPAIPTDPRRFLHKLMRPPDPCILFIGQMYAYKGIAALLAAADIVNGRGLAVNLVYIGPTTSYSENLFKEESRPWLYVLGPVSKQDKWDAIDAARVVCVPSSQEAFGLVLVEAWQKGVPVIGGDIPATREVVQHGRTGLLVPPGDVEALADALFDVCSDEAAAKEMGQHGAATAAERFTWKAVVDRVNVAYEAALRAS